MGTGLNDFLTGTYTLSSRAEMVVCFRAYIYGIDSLVGGDR